MADTLTALLGIGSGDDPALIGPERSPLTFAQLSSVVDRLGAALNRRGLGRGDVVALIADGSVEAATGFLGLASHAIAAPLDPALPVPEAAQYLRAVGATAIVASGRAVASAERAGRQQALPVLTLAADPTSGAGAVTLAGDTGFDPVTTGPGGPDDFALCLPTSGTTGAPKWVPLSHRNLALSAQAVAATLKLAPGDIGLSIMPLFHIHGLVAGLLAPLAAGSAVARAGPFDPFRVLDLMVGSGATWTTAVPTMLAIMTERAERRPDRAERLELRFVRASSSALAPAEAARIESVFGCPVIEAYGMTEAAHQIASNPLPPGARIAGSVGFAAGPEIAIANGEGGHVAQGEIGEVIVRGPTIMGGYLGDEAATAAAFFGPWLRTGDQGRLDAEGRLTLTGRIKELINRGGETIAPRQIDDVLLAHPAVLRAASFAVPHPRLGEEVAAAVVLRPGTQADEAVLRRHVGEHLSLNKVPARILIVDTLPAGATGKYQRRALARHFGLA